ncbi:MAG: hypothetical protein J6Y30_04975 [Treponema sp.]|nr:hypothetical protein [Treponema sp.]
MKIKTCLFIAFFLFALAACSKDTNLPASIETPLGTFKSCGTGEETWGYNYLFERDGKETALFAMFTPGAVSKKEVEKMLGLLQKFYSKLPKAEKDIISYAAKNAAEGKYEDVILNTGRVYCISYYQEEKAKDANMVYSLVTDEHIHGCDFVEVYSDLKGNLQSACLVGFQD